MKVRINKARGRYSLTHNDTEWQVVVRVPDTDKVLRAMFPEEREPDVTDRPPSEVVELIAARFAEYLYRSDRAKDDATLAWMREHAEVLDHAWAAERVCEILARIATLSREASDLMKAHSAPAQTEATAHA